MIDLTKKLRITAGVINMGGRIAWGSDTALMEEAADLIEEQQKRITELEQEQDADIELIVNRQSKITELTATVERLKKACELARDNHGKMLLTDPPQEAWKVNQVTARLVEAIAATPQQSLAGHDAEVARVAYKQGFNDVWNEDFFDEFYEHNELAEDCANQYANKIKTGDL